jgi:hypothetical protein
LTGRELAELKVQTICPVCGKSESVVISDSDLRKAKKEHRLISKAITHENEGHIFAMYINQEGKVRRRYCFDIVMNDKFSLEKEVFKDLEAIFSQMLEAAKKPD